MKITRSQLRKMIKEETLSVYRSVNEHGPGHEDPSEFELSHDDIDKLMTSLLKEPEESEEQEPEDIDHTADMGDDEVDRLAAMLSAGGGLDWDDEY